MSFSKRSDTAPVCHTKLLDSLKHWNDSFFWVDATAFPLFIPWHNNKTLKKDPYPKPTKCNAEVCEFFATHTAPFRKFPEPVLCFVGISRYYELDDNVYPTFLTDDDEEMDLFAFINHADPTKVRMGEKQIDERQTSLLESTRDHVLCRNNARSKMETTSILLTGPAKTTFGALYSSHDGPPYANGDLNMEHALNKNINDIINRYKMLDRKGLTPVTLREKSGGISKATAKAHMASFKLWRVLAPTNSLVPVGGKVYLHSFEDNLAAIEILSTLESAPAEKDTILWRLFDSGIMQPANFSLIDSDVILESSTLFLILSATNNFDDKRAMFESEFEKRYWAQLLRSGELIDITARRFNKERDDKEELFWMEISLLSTLKHKNVASLFGFCDEKIIITNFDETNGSLSVVDMGAKIGDICRCCACIE
ncbi:gypsy type transposase [Tanacetum coccineum]|uniref:Gypsy type transposase n=1 Tax=Tanacetum coccineum TaxID=301880 RepID=A0ABQ5E7C0_9ASTR